MEINTYFYLTVMALVTYAVRVLPLVLIKHEIKNRTFRSFLYYVPYVTLAVMTFHAIVDATKSPIAGIAALIIGVLLAWLGAKLFTVAACCCVAVLIVEFILV